MRYLYPIMLSRRHVLTTGLLAGASGFLRYDGPLQAVASQPRTKVSFDVPPGATDCAVHVYGDTKRHPYWEGRTYTPEPATVSELRQFHKALRVDRVVIVQATPYGTDNSCVVDSIREIGGSARGVAIIDDKTTEASLDEMHRGGVRGIRLNLGNQAATDAAAARRRLNIAAERMKRRNGWSLQVSASTPTFEVLQADLRAVAVPLVVDHFGEPRVAAGLGQPGFSAVIDLVKSGRAYVKISNADTLAALPDMSDLTPYAKALISANPERVLWGTAWPHPSAGAVPGRKSTDIAIHRPVDDGRVMNMLPVWAPDAATRKLILVDNPARLYGF